MHLRYIDALRGIAILMVIVVHAATLSGLTGRPIMLAFAGQRGVQLFYLISALTLFHSLDRLKREDRPYFRYALRRFFRIAPMFYVALIINLLYQGMAPREEAPLGIFASDILLTIFFLHGASPRAINSVVIGGWSVGVEAMFYVLLPLLYRITRTLFASVILLTTTATVCGVGSYYLGVYLRDWFEYWTFYWFPVELPVFCMGILVYYLEKSVRQKIRPHFYRRLSIVLIIASVFIFANSLPSSNYRLYWTSMAFVPLTLGLALHEWKLFVNPVTIFIGVRSYSIYLLHIFVMVALVKFFPSVRGSKFGCLVLYLSTTAVTLALSDLTYRFIEKPGTRFGRRCEEWGKADSVTTKR